MINKKHLSIEDHTRINENLNRFFEKSLSPDELRETINANFEKGLIDEEIKDKALEQLDNLIEKAEGSRGGKVIGHTKSGKPIYEKHEQSNTQHYSAEDHSDAMSAHLKEAQKYKEKNKKHLERIHSAGEKNDDSSLRSAEKDEKESGDKMLHHSQMAELHSKAMNSKLDKGSKKD